MFGTHFGTHKTSLYQIRHQKPKCLWLQLKQKEEHWKKYAEEGEEEKQAYCDTRRAAAVFFQMWHRLHWNFFLNWNVQDAVQSGRNRLQREIKTSPGYTQVQSLWTLWDAQMLCWLRTIKDIWWSPTSISWSLFSCLHRCQAATCFCAN